MVSGQRLSARASTVGAPMRSPARPRDHVLKRPAAPATGQGRHPHMQPIGCTYVDFRGSRKGQFEDGLHRSLKGRPRAAGSGDFARMRMPSPPRAGTHRTAVVRVWHARGVVSLEGHTCHHKCGNGVARVWHCVACRPADPLIDSNARFTTDHSRRARRWCAPSRALWR
jgi:hypothetical protein